MDQVVLSEHANFLLKLAPAPLNRMGALLKDFKMIMAGSFALKCAKLTDHSKDIDLISNSISGLIHMINNGWKVQPQNYNLNYLAQGWFEQYNLRHFRGNFIVNFILVREEDVQAHIFDSYDFDGCTLQWNGETWSIDPKVSLHDLFEHRILNYNVDILYKTFVNVTQDHIDRMNRVTKWTIANFHEKVAAKIWYDRIQKYEKRGFRVPQRGIVEKLLKSKTPLGEKVSEEKVCSPPKRRGKDSTVSDLIDELSHEIKKLTVLDYLNIHIIPKDDGSFGFEMTSD